MEELNEKIQVTTPEDIEDKYIEEWKSEQVGALASALAKAQSEMKGATKKSVNPFFKSNYADLHSVIESSFPYLSKHGLAVIQGNDVDVKGSF